MNSPEKAADLPGQEYWERGWSGLALPGRVDPHSPSIPFSYRTIGDYLTAQILKFGGGQGRDLIEIGCGCSQWLPYFAIEHGFRVSGLDYSPTGCRQAEAILSSAGVSGEILCRNFFDEPDRQYDVLVSFGVAEHFRPTEDCIRAFARFLKPGGLMITEIPNMSGLVGVTQKLVNQPVYDIHVPLTREQLAGAHTAAGLSVVDCRYLLSTGFTVCAPPSEDASAVALRNAALGALRKLSRFMWRFDARLPKTRVFSPYVVCSARKPA